MALCGRVNHWNCDGSMRKYSCHENIVAKILELIQNPVAKAAGFFFCTKSGHWTYISVKEVQSFAVVKR